VFSIQSVRIPRTAGLALALLLTAHEASAQGRIELTPFGASYYGLTHLATGTDPNNGNDLRIDQTNAFAVGARLSVPVGARLSVEGEFSFTMSGLRVTENDLFGPGVDGGVAQDGNIIHGSLRAVFSPRRSNLFLLAGPAIVRRGGDAWKGADGSDITDFGGVVGFGVRANVTPRFRLNFTAESYLYNFNGGASDGDFQADLLVSVGVPIALGH
jgi:hypothetical protein